MQSATDSVQYSRSKKIALFGLFLAFMMIAGLLERFIPLDGLAPGMRLGLANLAVVISLYLFSFRETLMLVIMKCLIMTLISGNVIALAYSLSGSLASFTAMQILIRSKIASPVGVSVAGAAFHNIAQIVVARFILGTWAIALYLPFLLVVGTVSGVLIGLLTKAVLPNLRRYLRLST